MIFDRYLTETEIVSYYRRYKDVFNSGDSTPPAQGRNISVMASTFGANWPTDRPDPMYQIDDCTDISGVYITINGAPAPVLDSAGWQPCLTANGHLQGPDLSPGLNTISFWFKDEYGNVTSSAQDIVVDYTVPSTPDPVAYWSFDDDSFVGERSYEPVNQLHAFRYSANTIVGKVGNAASFDGARKYIEVEHNTIIKPTDEFTIGFWVNIPTDYDDRTDRYIIGNRGSSAEGYAFRWVCESSCLPLTWADNQFFEFVLNLDGSDVILDVPQAQIGTGWQHFTATFDGRHIKLYQNGALKREKDLLSQRAITYSASNTSLIMGADASDVEKPSGGYLPGAVDEVAIWNTALYGSQVSDIYNNFSNNSTRIYDPGLAVITPPDARVTIHNPTKKTFGSRIRLSVSDCTDMNMVLVNDSPGGPGCKRCNWQPCNTYAGGILSAPLPSGLVTPRVWAKSFTGTVSAASGTANSASVTMNMFVTDIPRPKIHWALDSAASGYTSGSVINESLSWSPGDLDLLFPPESTVPREKAL